MVVESYIQNLLYTVDCVVIPNFGGFITQYESSQVHPMTNIFNPPKKRIAFNESLKSNDGLLIHEIQVGEDISKEEATKLVDDFAQAIIEELKEKELLVLEEIGTFSLNKEQKIQFEADSKANYLDDSFGLTELYFKPILREEEIDDDMKRVHPSQARQAVRRAPVQKRKRPVASNEAENSNASAEPKQEKLAENKSTETATVSSENTEVKEKKGNKNPVFIALPILLLLIAVGGGLFLMQKNSKGGSSVEMAGVGSSLIDSGASNEADGTSTLAEEVQEVSEDVIETTEEVTESVEETTEEIVEEVVEAKPATISNSNARYFIIGGSFEERNRADKMAASVEGGEVLESDGRYRVSIASFTSKKEAFSSLDNYKGEYGNDIWVFIK